MENIGFSRNKLNYFIQKGIQFLYKNAYELTNLIVDTFSKLLVFLRDSVIHVKNSFWGRDAKASISNLLYHHNVISFETCNTINNVTF